MADEFRGLILKW